MTKQGWMVVSLSVLTGWLPMMANASTVRPAFTDQPQVVNASKPASMPFRQVISGSTMKMRSVVK